jgi:hypothetical protein
MAGVSKCEEMVPSVLGTSTFREENPALLHGRSRQACDQPELICAMPSIPLASKPEGYDDTQAAGRMRRDILRGGGPGVIRDALQCTV